jgi:hypothetical protein
MKVTPMFALMSGQLGRSGLFNNSLAKARVAGFFKDINIDKS